MYKMDTPKGLNPAEQVKKKKKKNPTIFTCHTVKYTECPIPDDFVELLQLLATIILSALTSKLGVLLLHIAQLHHQLLTWDTLLVYLLVPVTGYPATTDITRDH